MVIKIRGMAALAVFFLFASGSLFAQIPRSLNFGTQISGTLKAGEEQWFSVRPPGDGIVVVETFGDDIDTYLEVYDDVRNFISENDDGGEGVNARLEIFVDAGQTYLFKLRCYSEEESGPYRLLATFESLAADREQNTDRSRAVLIKPWEPIPVFIRSAGESRWYRYDLTNPESLLIVETTGSLDTLLTIYDDRGRVIEEDDDSGEDSNAYLMLRRGRGTVYIEVTAYGSSMGRTTLYIEVWRRD